MSLQCQPFSYQCGFYLLLLIFASFLYLQDGAPTFDSPSAPFIFHMPTVVATETQIVQFNISGVNGTLTCNILAIVPASNGFECRAGTTHCACYIKAGQTWTSGTQYNLTVEAFDSGHVGNSSTFGALIIDVQNMAPSFDNLPATLSNVDADTVMPRIHNIYTISATDADGDLIFFFLYNNIGIFSINKVTGEVRANKDLHYLTSQVILLDIGASDADDINDTKMVHAILTLNVTNGNHVPYISNWLLTSTAVVLESVPANTKLCDANVENIDNDVLSYDITVHPSPGSRLFYFDRTCTCLKINGAGSLNYERVQQYLISIQIRDKWSASPTYSCTVTVMDDNDLPVFTKAVYPVSIMEEVSITVDPSFTCSDEDGDSFTYSFMPVNNSNWFNIDPQSGVITVNNPIDRDTLASNQIYLTVFATDDHSGKGSAQVLINVGDINDNAPTFQKTTYQLRTTQFTGAGSIIGSIAATDIDEGTNAKFIYSCGTQSDYKCLSDGSITTSTDLSSVAYGTTIQLVCYASDFGTPAKTGTTYVDITKTRAPASTTPTTTTTTEINSWDTTEFIVLFSVLVALVGLLLLCGCYFCMRMCITGYCCGGPVGDCLGYQNADHRHVHQSNRVGYYDYGEEDKSSRNGESTQSQRESVRHYPMVKDRY